MYGVFGVGMNIGCILKYEGEVYCRVEDIAQSGKRNRSVQQTLNQLLREVREIHPK